MDGLAVRITLPADKLRDTLVAWRYLCDQVIVYEHPSGSAERTHCHMLIINPTHCVRSFKDKSGIANGGNSLWSFKKAQGSPLWPKYITYMSKGIYDPDSIEGRNPYYTWKDCERFKYDWINKRPLGPRVPPRHQKWLDFKEKLLKSPGWIAWKEQNPTKAETENFVKRAAHITCVTEERFGHRDQQAQNEIVSYTRSFMDYLDEIKYPYKL